MPATLKQRHLPVGKRASSQSERMKELSDEAASIRHLHLQGKLSDTEVKLQLRQLKQRYQGFIDRFIAAE